MMLLKCALISGQRSEEGRMGGVWEVCGWVGGGMTPM